MATPHTNSVFIVGTARFVKVRKVGDRFVTNFSLGYVDKSGKKHYFPAESWRMTREQSDFLKNSDDMILVKGSLKYNAYTNKAGEEKKVVLLNVYEFEPFTGGTPVTASVQTRAPSASHDDMVEDDDFEEEDPFGAV